MYNDIIYEEDKDTNIVKDCFPNTSDDNKRFNKTSWYMKNNVKLSEDIIPIILMEVKSNGRKLLAYILTHLKYNKTVIKLDRKDVLKYLGTNDYAIITHGINELLALGIIEKIDTNEKDVFNIPMRFIVRGNVNSMITSIEEKKREQEFEAKENEVVKSYKELSENHKLKLKLKK